MFKKLLRILFYTYAYLFLFIGFLRLWALLSIDSPSGLYFRVLYSFDSTYYFAYILSIGQAILTIIHFIPLVLYLGKSYVLPIKFWRYLFVLRIIFDISGHSWEINHLTSFYHSRPLVAIIVFLQYTSLYIPSYIGCYRYAFKQKNLQLELFKQSSQPKTL